MTMQVTLTYPDSLYQKAKRLAERSDAKLEDVLLEFARWGAATVPDTTSEIDPDVEREKQAYIKMHPHLYKQFPGQHVAVYQGQLIDRDPDKETLWARIEETYPDVFVWVTTVREEPIRTVNTTHNFP